MCAVLPTSSHSSDADFARIISRKFVHGRFIIVGASSQELERQFAEVKRDAVLIWSPGDLMMKLEQGEAAARFEAGVWFYPSGDNDDDRLVETLSHCAASIVLVPGPGADAATRRPRLVQCFERFGLLPDYECDLMELDPAAVCLRHLPSADAGELRPKVETAFARFNRALGDLKRSLQIRASELEGAHRHIAALEEKLLKLKEYRRELKLLKEQKQMLRKSPERRVGQALLAPYRIPEKLVKAAWKKLWRSAGSKRPIAKTQYQEWLERHRASAGGLDRMRHEASAFASRPLISIITPVFDTPVRWLEEAVESVLAQAYENWELLLINDGSSTSDLLEALPALAARDRRITLAEVGKHKGISAALNQGLELARGEWVTFLDHDDVLEPDALFQILSLLQTHPDADLIYSDEDKLA